MVESMTTALLWALAIIGAWNGLNAVARVYYGAPWWPYLWTLLFGAWAAIILLLRGS